MDFRKYLEKAALEIDREVEKILDQEIKNAGKIDQKLVPLLKAFADSCKGGKRIRGTLVKLGYEIGRIHLPGVSPDFARDKKAHLEGVLKIAAAYEIFHTSILAHDDIMDKSPLRRGRKSLYNEVGVSHAITLADLGFFLAIKIISEAKFDDKGKITAIKFFSNTMMDTAIGQMLDITNGDPETTAKFKTARYTISGPLILGAILGGADKRLPGLLGVFGEDLGVVFQLRDDILDNEALDWSGQRGVKYVSAAKLVIPKITKDQTVRKLLTEMAEYLIKRKS